MKKAILVTLSLLGICCLAIAETRNVSSDPCVGFIPIQSSVTPTGARMYSIPISAVSGCKFTPSVALSYNSQSGNNVAGFGWGLTGLSSISVRSKSYYYDGVYEGAICSNPDSEYALDGVPLVQSSKRVSGFAYETTRGNILVKKHVFSSDGSISHFTALFPNGARGVFGYPDKRSSQRVYPITQLVDIEGNTINFEYDYNPWGDTYYIREITYGSGAVMAFSWKNRSEIAPYMFASSGRQVSSLRYLLDGIMCKDGEDTVYDYKLTHEYKDGVALLKEVHCSSMGSELRPVSFEYGADVNIANDKVFKEKASSSFQRPNSQGAIFEKAKLNPGSTCDGLIIYPKKKPYALLRVPGTYDKYGSQYLESDEIYFDIMGTEENRTYSSFSKMSVGSGFQMIKPVDYNGDGVDELVKINTRYSNPNNAWYPNSNSTVVTVSLCSFDRERKRCIETDQFDITIHAFTILAKGRSALYFQAECFYYFGDFRGDGKKMLLIISRQNSQFVLVDLNTKAVVSESSLFTMKEGEDNLIIAADFENDGKTDLCHVTDSGLQVYSVPDMNGSSFSLRTTYIGASLNQLCTDLHWAPTGVSEILPTKLFPIDLNGDGYLDIAAAPALYVEWNDTYGVSSSEWHFAYFDGCRFNSERAVLFPRAKKDLSDNYIVFSDVDKDGLPDMLYRNNCKLYVLPNVDGKISLEHYYDTGITIPETSDFIPGSITFWGTDGDVAIADSYLRLFESGIDHIQNRRIVRLTDSFGIEHNNFYGKTSSLDAAYSIDVSRTFSSRSGYSRISAELPVLAREVTVCEDTLESRVYKYYDAVYNHRGLGFCGFGKIRTYDCVANDETIQVNNPEKFGVVTEVTRSKGAGGIPYSIVTNTYDNNSTTYGKLNPRLTKSVTEDGLTGVVSETSYTYGSYDLPTSVVTSRRIGSGPVQKETVTRSYENSVSSSKYVLGVVTEESVVKGSDGDGRLSWKERSVTTYDSSYRPLTNKRYVGQYGRAPRELFARRGLNAFSRSSGVGALGLYVDPDPEPWDPDPGEPEDPGDPEDPGEPAPESDDDGLEYDDYDATNLVSETRWSYDSHGNVISKSTAPYGAVEFTVETYTYDSDGRYLLSTTNALGQTTTFSDYTVHGKPLIVTDYHGWDTEYSYDAWGNQTSVAYPNGEIEHTTVSWGGSGLYTVAHTYTSKSSPETVTHYDALGREIRSGVKRYDGQWQWTDKEYDSRGRVSRTSLPYRDGGTVYWNTCEYDDYDRPTKITEASGKMSSWSYSGTSTTTVKDGVTSTSTTDASGNVVSVTDSGGTITYSLRVDGQPTSVIAPGNVRTCFTYDLYGRRTKLDDPSAGTRTESYVWNSDGSSELTHTNPNGTIKTYTDKYGRTTLVERPGEYNTSYTYNREGQLETEQSTNGTGTEYTYDDLDRVKTVKETVPDGKWLKKVYSYGDGGVLSSVQYISQDGPITTETYTYANGHNTGITLADGTVVWSLTGENDLGMVTSLVSGGITREYGFTAFGMPTYRRMDGGNLQDFTYQFDVATGNLQMRSDGVNGQTETFGYDNLNRLVSIGSRQITYADNGNILSMDGVGAMDYTAIDRPYQITMLTPEESGLVPKSPQSVTYTCYSRPSVISEDSNWTSFTYNGSGDRVKMFVCDPYPSHPITKLVRYYIGGRYECDRSSGNTTERLYLGGDAYSAPMVYQRENDGQWAAYNIGRDYLGNITQIATVDGTLVAEYSYDPWGRLRDPQTLDIYTPGNEPELFLGRGFTGHEHLKWYGLINMNARLYDPLLGRFLSPDPYVQAPDFTQNFNRYSYALNNPLRYTDESGKSALLALALFGGITNWMLNGAQFNLKGLGHFCSGTLGAYAGLYVGGILAAELGTIGFGSGFGVSAFSTATTGLITGTIDSWISGKDFVGGLADGVKSGCIGMFTGGLIGGFFAGLSAIEHGGDFMTGIGACMDYTYVNDPVDMAVEYSQENVQSFSDKHFVAPDWIKLKADGSVPRGYTIDEFGIARNRAGDKLYGCCSKTGNSEYTTYIFKAACSSKQRLYLTLGHEYYHAFLSRVGIPNEVEQHRIITDWQLRQAVEWDFGLKEQVRYYNMFHHDLTDYNYLNLNKFIPIKSRWYIL